MCHDLDSMTTRKHRNLTRDPREGEYSEISGDDDWLLRDTPGATLWGWGGDDSHMDMFNYVPTDAGLVLWRCDGHRERWLARADAYAADYDYEALIAKDPADADIYTKEHPYALAIRERVAELEARFNRLGNKRKRR